MTEAIPLATDLEDAALEAHRAGAEAFTVRLPWRAGMVLAECLRAYFAPDRSDACFACGTHRDSAIDRQIEILDEQLFRLAYMLKEVEDIATEQSGSVPLRDDKKQLEMIRQDMKSGAMKQRAKMRRPTARVALDDETRATVVDQPGCLPGETVSQLMARKNRELNG